MMHRTTDEAFPPLAYNCPPCGRLAACHPL